MNSERTRQPRVQGPLVRADGSRFWLGRVDARRRMVLPKEVMEELGWRPGDRLQLDVVEREGTKVLEIRNADALARANTPLICWSASR